jgi:oxygen-dependent protoporphyrinogen oxidase
MIRIIRYPGAIPQLLPDHPERMESVRQYLRAAPGIFLAGNYLTGVGVEHAVGSGYDAADEARTFLAGAAAPEPGTQ